MILSQQQTLSGDDMEEKQYKANDNGFIREIKSDLEANLDKFRDPIVMAEFAFRLLEERENTNRLMKTLVERLDKLEAQMQGKSVETHSIELLPEIDSQIMEFVEGAGKVTAEEVRKRFNYKGKNAASARLNRLCDSNRLQKQQVGKKLYFFPNRL